MRETCALTGEHKSVVQRGGLLRQREQKSEDAADCVQTLQRVADVVRNAANGRIRPAVIGHDVRVQIDVVYLKAVDDAAHFAADALSFVYRQKSRKINQQVRPSSGTDVYPHVPILRPHAARFHERRISSVTFTSAHLYGNVYIQGGRGPGAGRFVRCWDSGGAKFAKMGGSLPWTPMNRRAKFDVAWLYPRRSIP